MNFIIPLGPVLLLTQPSSHSTQFLKTKIQKGKKKQANKQNKTKTSTEQPKIEENIFGRKKCADTRANEKSSTHYC